MYVNKKAVKLELLQMAQDTNANFTRVAAEVYDHLDAVIVRELKRVAEQSKTQKTAKAPI